MGAPGNLLAGLTQRRKGIAGAPHASRAGGGRKDRESLGQRVRAALTARHDTDQTLRHGVRGTQAIRIRQVQRARRIPSVAIYLGSRQNYRYPTSTDTRNSEETQKFEEPL